MATNDAVLAALEAQGAWLREELREMRARLDKIDEGIDEGRRRDASDINPQKSYSCEQAGRFLSRHTIWKRVKASLIETIPQPAGSTVIRIRGTTLITLLEPATAGAARTA